MALPAEKKQMLMRVKYWKSFVVIGPSKIAVKLAEDIGLRIELKLNLSFWLFWDTSWPTKFRDVGIGGNYLTHSKTYEQRRTAFYYNNLVNRREFTGWQEDGAKHINDRATEIFNERMSKYRKPDIDPQLEKDLLSYIQKRKKRPDRYAWNRTAPVLSGDVIISRRSAFVFFK